MIARILGSSPGLPTLGRSHSAFWCRVYNRNILFDCGEGTARRLLEFGMDIDFLDAIIISHLHPDHSAGIFMVLQMFHLQKRVKPLTIYLPEELKSFSAMMNIFYLFPDRFGFAVILSDVRSLNDQYPEILPQANSHLLSYKDYIKQKNHPNPMISYSFLIRTGEKVILYTSDIDNTEPLTEFIKEADIVIIDALHPSREDISTIIKQPGKMVILIHGISAELEAHLETNHYSNVIIAEDGYKIDE